MEVWLHLKLVLENSGEHRAHREPENMEYQLVGLHQKFVLENSGKHRAHREQENKEQLLASWVAFEVSAGEQWKTEHVENQRTWNTSKLDCI